MIEKNIPLPTINADIKQYFLNFEKMVVGDSEFLTCSRTLINRAVKKARELPAWSWWFLESKLRRDFKTRTWKKDGDTGIRVWRIK